jgi:hypothetical protein
MSKAKSQIEALQKLFSNKRAYTMDDLLDRVSTATGRSATAGSLNVALSKLRAQGFSVETQRGARDGSTQTKYRGAAITV